MRTTFVEENSKSGVPDTVLTHEKPESVEAGMTKWPKRVKHRNKVLARIYRPCAGRGSYRVAWTALGKRMMKSFPTYSGTGGALEYAEELVKDLAKGSQVSTLTPGQARDALIAFERLHDFYVATGRRVSLPAVASEWCEN